MKIPADLSVVGVDDVPLCSYLPITLSSIRQRYKAITKAAADLLISRIEGSEILPARQEVFSTIYTPRQSTGATKG